MKDEERLSYYDRRSGRLRTDPVFARGFVDWCYNAASGWALTNLLFSRRVVSEAYGRLHKTRWSRRMIPRFVASMGVDLSEVPRPLQDFGSFNEFIIRDIDLSRRPVDPDPAVCVSPADGRVLVYPRIRAGTPFPIKRAIFDLAGLLGDDRLAADYDGGSLAVVRLHLADYHHIHFPDSGRPGPAASIGGRYFAVSPYPRLRRVPFYARNHRVVTLFDSDHFGRLAVVEVGAFTVGSIRQRYRPGERVAKGERKGYFELGGSVVVLLFPEGKIRFDEDLLAHSEEGVETYVRLGESIGRAGPVPLSAHARGA